MCWHWPTVCVVRTEGRCLKWIGIQASGSQRLTRQSSGVSEDFGTLLVHATGRSERPKALPRVYSRYREEVRTYDEGTLRNSSVSENMSEKCSEKTNESDRELGHCIKRNRREAN